MKRRSGNGWVAVILVILTFVIGTMVGHVLQLGSLSAPIGFAPVALNLYVVSLTVSLHTNLLGLIGIVVGLIATRYV